MGFDRSGVFAVILAGGSGTRFWPASRRLCPKQLLSLGGDGQPCLLAETVARIAPLVPPENVLIATGSHLLEATRAALPHLPESSFLAEPQAKNTAPCIAWAAQVIASRDPEAKVLVLPSDQHVTDPQEFLRVLICAVDEAEDGRIVTVGIVPTRPETGYGYIQKGAPREAQVFEVDSFKEKPDLATARRYVESGAYLWNAGMFIFRARDMLSAVECHLPRLSAGLAELVQARAGLLAGEGVVRFFAEAESVSIDHGVMEKARALSVVAGDFGWTDLGSWESLWEMRAKDVAGNAARPGDVLVDASRNLILDLRTAGAREPVTALVGVSDLCVVQTDDALLILPRGDSQRVREVVATLSARGRSDLL